MRIGRGGKETEKISPTIQNSTKAQILMELRMTEQKKPLLMHK